MLIPLVCTQCGGKLEAEKTQVIESGNMFIVLSGQTLKCPHCETKFVSGDKIKRFSEQPVISIGGRVTGSNCFPSKAIGQMR